MPLLVLYELQKSARRSKNEQGLLHLSDPQQQKAGRDRTHIASSTDNTGHTAECFAINERHQCIGGAASHMGEQSESEHRQHRQMEAVHHRKHQQPKPLTHHQHKQHFGARIQTATARHLVGNPATERTGKQRQQAEAASHQPSGLQ
jgi:hypothetical protein